MHQTILVTGGSKGIGRACCDALAKLDVAVVSLSRTKPADLPASEAFHSIDLADLEQLSVLVNQLTQQYNFTGVICNAGRGDIGSLENFSSLQISQSLLFNIASPLTVVRHCLPGLRKQSRSNIVFIGSTSALNGARYGSLYSAAKFALRGAAQALRHELAGANCHVGIIHPGMVRTGFFDTLPFSPGPQEAHALHAGDVASAVVSMLMSPDHAVVSELTIQPRQHVVNKKSSLP